MKVIFFSNYINHHQLPLAYAFNRIPGVNYIFVATTPFNEKRAQMGYRDENERYDFVLRAYENKRNESLAYQLAKEADIVIVGSAHDSYMMERLKAGKVTFHTSERYFKKGLNIKTFPRYFASAMKHIRPYQNLPLYYLCSSAYTAKDVNTFTSFKNRCFKWAYFTEISENRKNALLEKKEQNKIPVILWAGRFLPWKHPDAAIRVAKRLREEGYDFQMNIVGGGEMEKQLKELSEESNLSENIQFLGFLPPETVRCYMEKSDIFLFTSDFNEGWGAVLNEAMSSGCASIASHACGSSPFLIRDGENGYLYQNDHEDQLFRRTALLLKDTLNRRKLGIQAYQDMCDVWNPRVASERLIKLYETINNGEEAFLYKDGPCSPAPILGNEWYKEDKDS